MVRQEKNIIPEAYKSIYSGFPWAKRDEISIKVSDSEKLKLEKVIGNNINFLYWEKIFYLCYGDLDFLKKTLS